MITADISRMGREARWKNVKTWPIGQRRCRKCNELKQLIAFHKHQRCLKGINTICKACRKSIGRKYRVLLSEEYNLFQRTKSRAKKRRLDFNIVISDIVIPRVCPILNMPLVKCTPYAPSIDRINPNKGYIKGNIRIISNRANMLKNNGTIEEFELILKDLKQGGVCQLQ